MANTWQPPPPYHRLDPTKTTYSYFLEPKKTKESDNHSTRSNSQPYGPKLHPHLAKHILGKDLKLGLKPKSISNKENLSWLLELFVWTTCHIAFKQHQSNLILFQCIWFNQFTVLLFLRSNIHLHRMHYSHIRWTVSWTVKSYMNSGMKNTMWIVRAYEHYLCEQCMCTVHE